MIFMPFKDQTVWITGATGGIGKEMVRLFYNQGGQLILLGRNKYKILETLQDIGGYYKDITIREIDITSEQSIEELVDDHPDPPQVLIHCAAAEGKIAPLTEFSLDDWNNIINTDLTGTFLVVRTAARLMKKARYGRIVILSSIHSKITYPQRAAYAAAKAGVDGLVRCAALDLAPYSITINSICPGPIDTPRTKGFLSKDKEMEQGLTSRIPCGRIGTTREVAKLALYLAGKDSGYLTGESIMLDGGLSKSAWWRDYRDLCNDR